MPKSIVAVFDGEVFCPQESVPLQPNTRVRITIETVTPMENERTSFFETARQLNLEGPPDWSMRWKEFLYGNQNHEE